MGGRNLPRLVAQLFPDSTATRLPRSTGHDARHDGGTHPYERTGVSCRTMHETHARLRVSQAGVGSAVWGLVAARLATAITAVAKEIRARRAMHELSGMGESMLRDIGLTRDDVERAVRYGRP